MYQGKKVLLIAGGGTLGHYTAKELLTLGASVDVLCPEDKVSDNERLVFHKGLGTFDFLSKLFAENRYDGIVNFIHYPNVEEYKSIHPLLMSNTDHLIFLSSYRVYADLEHPIKESSPRINDVTSDAEYFANEDYSNPKSIEEDYLRTECKGQNWTIVRPVISFSCHRFDIFTHSGKAPLDSRVLKLPRFAKDLHAGFDWAGNSGKLIANLLFKKRAIGEEFTISSAQNLTWGEVADIYTNVVGTEFEWVSEEDFLESNKVSPWVYYYDRKYDRLIDNSKVLDVTGLKKEDFSDIAFGLREELRRLNSL